MPGQGKKSHVAKIQIDTITRYLSAEKSVSLFQLKANIPQQHVSGYSSNISTKS